MPILSVDTEWTPVEHEGRNDQLPDVVQVSDGKRVVIIQCNKMTRKLPTLYATSCPCTDFLRGVPALLLDIIQSEDVIITGVAIAGMFFIRCLDTLLNGLTDDLRRIANWAELKDFSFPKIPNLINVVDGVELSVKQKAQARQEAQEKRLNMVLPILRARKADLIGDIKVLEDSLKSSSRRALERRELI
ncbi:hypothetical protein HWV62_8849 [Athelia sp. TMB]|nr:hypothetical protein HWV62_8849 [Athelia sp. TMB]